MPSSFRRSSLVSRRVQTRIDTRRKAGDIAQNAGGAFKSLARWGGFGFSAVVDFFDIDFSEVASLFFEAYMEIKTFDPNQTDKEIQDKIKANNQALANTTAEALGEYLGRGAFRYLNAAIGKGDKEIAGVKIPVVSQAIGIALAEDNADETVEAVRRVLGQAAGAMTSNTFLTMVLEARKAELFGMKSITDDSLPNGSLATKIDESVEKLPEFFREPVKNLIEGVESGFFDAFYVAAATVDSHVAAMQYAVSDSGPVRTIELETADGQTYEMTGQQGHLFQAIPLVTAGVELRGGDYFGDIPVEIYPKPSERFARVFFKGYAKGKDGKKKLQETTILIPNAKPKIDGFGLKGYTYTQGPIRVQAVGKTSRRPIRIHATSEAEGKRIITELMQRLSTESPDEGMWKVSDKKSSSKNQKASTKQVTAFRVLHLDNTKAQHEMERFDLRWKPPAGAPKP